MKKRRKLGMTLAELSIVLAVIAIISTVVVTFFALVSERTRVASAKLDALNDISVVESMTEAWIDASLAANKTIVFSGEIDDLWSSYVVTNSMEASDDKLTFDEEAKKFTSKIGEKESSVSLETVEQVEFKSLAPEDGNDVIYFCKISCKIPYQEELYVYTFCVNPFIGDVID